MSAPPTPWEVPPPVLFNAWKHHAAAIRFRIAECARPGPDSLDQLAQSLVVIGNQLMDLYTGALLPVEIAQEVLSHLERDGRLAPQPYRLWVQERGGYGMATLSDGSEWCLRAADEDDRYIHVHPGRWVKNTCRVRANVLKTAVMVLAYVGIHGGDPFGRVVVNEVRRRYLNLEPLGQNLDAEHGLGELVTLLRGSRDPA